jgi:integrase
MMTRNRANGEGTVYPRKNNQGKVIGYRASYWVRTANGRTRRYVSGKTKTEALAALRKATADRDGGLVFDAKNLKLGRYLERWLQDSVKGTVKQTTYEGYERLARVHLVPTVGDVKLRLLTPVHIRALYREKIASGLAATSVQRIHALLHKALKEAVNDGLIPRNVTDAVKAPRQQRKEMKTFTPEQAHAFLDAAKEDRLGALYVVAIHTGLRQGELFGLRWEDVDLEAGTLSVHRTLSGAKGGPTFTTPKNDKPRRVRLTSQAIEALRDHRKRQLEERMRFAGLWQDHGLVFCSTVGTPLSRHNVYNRSFKPLLERAGLPRTFRFHDLRHTFATLMASCGGHSTVVQEMLGHATVNITLDLYSHVLPDMQEDAVDRLGALLS